MGTWGPAIKSNDTSSDVYGAFFDRYNEGEAPLDISRQLIHHNQDIIQDEYEGHNFWFALGLALWETKSLPPEVYGKIRETITTGSDLAVWKELGASDAEIRQRGLALNKFLEKIGTEKPTAKRRKRKKQYPPAFEKGACLAFALTSGGYGGAVVLAADYDSGMGYNLIVSTRIHQPTKPTLSDFLNAKVLVKTFGNWNQRPALSWYSAGRHFTKCATVFEVVGQIEIAIDYPLDAYAPGAMFSPWQEIQSAVEAQLAHEVAGERPTPLSLTHYTGKKRWWKF